MAMCMLLRTGTDFLLDEESVMRITFVEGVKDENYCMAKSCINM